MPDVAIVPKRKRGRPSGARSVTRTPEVKSSYAHFITAGHEWPGIEGDSNDAIFERIKARSADVIAGVPFPVRFAKLLKLPQRVADEVLAGIKPLTTSMLARAASGTATSVHWLLLGEGNINPSGQSFEDEWEFIKCFRNASACMRRHIAFMFTFDGVMAKLEWPIRNRVLSGLREVLRTTGDDHDWLANAIGRCMERYAIGSAELDGLTAIFTPVHEALGAFGPEYPMGLDGYLVQQSMLAR